MSSSASSDSASTTRSTLPSRVAAADACANSRAAPARSASSRPASARSTSACDRQTLHSGSQAAARSLSDRIRSGPPAHISARTMARAESNEAVPSTGTRSNVAPSRTADHRSASPARPVRTAVWAARATSGG